MATIRDLYEKSDEYKNLPKGKNKDKTPWSEDDSGNPDFSDKYLESVRGVVNDKKYSDTLTNK